MVVVMVVVVVMVMVVVLMFVVVLVVVHRVMMVVMAIVVLGASDNGNGDCPYDCVVGCGCPYVSGGGGTYRSIPRSNPRTVFYIYFIIVHIRSLYYSW
jgi:hypothetical protein